ncbi:MAG TPA: WhiB family transcriptional regulator [Mycobacteriales bacterium]|nr:WhiB family transcriptional regulator [Mycobacteriales bacterium]
MANSSQREVHTARPAAVSEHWDWQLQGLCRDTDGDLFFHPYGEREPSRGRRERAAQAICADCPVLLTCRAYALAAREPYGVWGGLTESDRVEILGAQDRGAPPIVERVPRTVDVA